MDLSSSEDVDENDELLESLFTSAVSTEVSRVRRGRSTSSKEYNASDRFDSIYLFRAGDDDEEISLDRIWDQYEIDPRRECCI